MVGALVEVAVPLGVDLGQFDEEDLHLHGRNPRPSEPFDRDRPLLIAARPVLEDLAILGAVDSDDRGGAGRFDRTIPWVAW